MTPELDKALEIAGWPEGVTWSEGLGWYWYKPIATQPGPINTLLYNNAAHALIEKHLREWLENKWDVQGGRVTLPPESEGAGEWVYIVTCHERQTWEEVHEGRGRALLEALCNAVIATGEKK